jgi:hypothetical protein
MLRWRWTLRSRMKKRAGKSGLRWSRARLVRCLRLGARLWGSRAARWPRGGRRPRWRGRQKRSRVAALREARAAVGAWAARLWLVRTLTATPGRPRKSGCPEDFPTACTHYKGAFQLPARQEVSAKWCAVRRRAWESRQFSGRTVEGEPRVQSRGAGSAPGAMVCDLGDPAPAFGADAFALADPLE